MAEYTVSQLAELLVINEHVVYYHIRKGNLKAEKKTLLNDFTRLYITHEECLRFLDWFLFDKWKNAGASYKKIPNVDEYNLNENQYNDYVALKIQRDKEILKCKYLHKMRYKNIALKFNLKVKTIDKIILKNKETQFVEELNHSN